MDADDRELFCHLMAKATAMLEDAASTAAEGQSSQLSQERMIEIAHRLQAATQDVAALAGASSVISSRGINQDD